MDRNSFSARSRLAGIGTLAAALIAGVSAPAFAQDRSPERGAPYHRFHPMDPEARADRMEYRVKRMFSSVKASEEQKTRAGTVVRRALADLQPIQAKLRDGRKASIELLSRPTIDRNAIEAQRAQQASLREAISKRMTQALEDLAEILTPEQRTALAQRMSQRFGAGRTS